MTKFYTTISLLNGSKLSERIKISDLNVQTADNLSKLAEV